MKKQKFFILLSVVSIAVAILLLLMSRYAVFADYIDLSWGSLVFFVVFTILMFFLSEKAALSDNKNTFSNVVIGFIAGKLFVTVMIVFLYNQIVKPEGMWFIVPFFIVYTSFSVFETYFMMKLGKTGTK